jgi:hypothetical protein
VSFDIFLSYAHEDKADVALPLAQHLRDLGFSVWIDESEINVGANIGDRIERALASSDFGVVLLSRHYLKKSWTLRELAALLAKERRDTVILPICHGILMKDLHGENSVLLNRFAASTEQGLRTTAEQIGTAISRLRSESGESKPDLEEPQRFRRHAPRRLQTGGALAPDAVYVDRTTDDEMWGAVQKPAGIATLTAPRRMGKSSLLLRLREKATLNRRVVGIDLTSMGKPDPGASWLYKVTEVMADKLEKLRPDPAGFQSRSTVGETFVDFINGIDGEVLVIIDEGDALQGDALQELSGALALAVSKQIRHERGSVYFVFTSTNLQFVDLLTSNHSELGFHTRLPLFTKRETERLFELAKVGVSDSQLEQIFEWTGGWPYFVAWSADQLARGENISESFERFPMALLEVVFPRLSAQEVTTLWRICDGRIPKPTLAESLLQRGILVRNKSRYGFTGRLFKEYFMSIFERPRRWFSFLGW